MLLSSAGPRSAAMGPLLCLSRHEFTAAARSHWRVRGGRSALLSSRRPAAPDDIGRVRWRRSPFNRESVIGGQRVSCRDCTKPRHFRVALVLPRSGVVSLPGIPMSDATRRFTSHAAGSAQAPARWPPAPRWPRSSPPAAAGRPPRRAAGVSTLGTVPGGCTGPRAGHRRRLRAGRATAAPRWWSRRRRVPAVAHQRSSFTVIEAVCTHEGCTVNGADGRQLRLPVPRLALQPQRPGGARSGEGDPPAVRHHASPTAS